MNPVKLLSFSRVTAGVLFKVGVSNLNNAEFCALMEAKNKKKLDKKARIQSNKYDVELKKYMDGTEAMKKSVLHYTAMKDEVYFIISEKEKKTVINRIQAILQLNFFKKNGNLWRCEARGAIGSNNT